MESPRWGRVWEEVAAQLLLHVGPGSEDFFHETPP